MKIVSSVEKLKNKLFTVSEDHAIEPGGFEIKRYIVHHRGSAVMMPVDDRKRVLLKVIQAAPSKEALLSAIDSASRMPSENDKAQILVAAAKLSTDSGVRSAVQQACSKMRSDNDYRRVASALLSSGPQ